MSSWSAFAGGESALAPGPAGCASPPCPGSLPYIVGIENSAPSFTPDGQRAVTFLVLV